MELDTAGPAPCEARVGAALRAGWETTKVHFWILLGLMLLTMLIMGVLDAPFSIAEAFGPETIAFLLSVQLAGGLLSLLVGIPLDTGLAWANLQAARGEKPTLDMLWAGFRRYRDVTLAGAAMAGLVIVGFILLIVPGIIAALRLYMVPFLVLDEGLKPKAALRASWEATRGHGWLLLRFFLAAIGILILGLFALFVGVFVAAVLLESASAHLYRAMREPGTTGHPARSALLT